MHPLFKLQYLLPMLAMLKPTSRWIQNTFFADHATHGTRDVRVDIYDRSRRTAGFTAPEHQTNMRTKSGYISRRFTPAYIKEGMSYIPDDLFDRAPGQTTDSLDSTALAVLLQRDMYDIDDMEHRLIEKMCIEALVDHQVTVTGRGYNQVVDMLFEAEQTVTLGAAAKWDTGSAINIYEDIQAAISGNRKRTGLGGGTVVVFGSTARKWATGNAAFMAQLDKLHYKIGEVEMVGFNEQGVREFGSLDKGNIRLVEYQEWYQDDAGVDQPMFPANKVLVAALGARTMLEFGAIQDFAASGTGVLRKAERFMKSWPKDDPSLWCWNLQTAPLPVPIQNGAFTTIVATS